LFFFHLFYLFWISKMKSILSFLFFVSVTQRNLFIIV
jgi:hypothetical protein